MSSAADENFFSRAKTRTSRGSGWRPEKSWGLVALPDTASESFGLIFPVPFGDRRRCQNCNGFGIRGITRSISPNAVPEIFAVGLVGLGIWTMTGDGWPLNKIIRICRLARLAAKGVRRGVDIGKFFVKLAFWVW